MTKKSKRLHKRLMGIGRNAANFAVDCQSDAVMEVFTEALNLPGAKCITNVYKANSGVHPRIKFAKMRTEGL